MSDNNKNLPATRTSSGLQSAPAAGGVFNLVPKSLEEAMKFADLISKSNLCPQGFRGKPADVLIAVQIGAELGVSPLQALANIAVINGRATLWGDLVVGLVQQSGQLEYLMDHWDEQTQTATVRIKRRGKPERIERFSMADARRARLDGKDTYKQYPQKMCTWRAKTFGIRAEFADVLKGLTTAEEAMDLPPAEPPITVYAQNDQAPQIPPPPAPGSTLGGPPPDDEWLKGFTGEDEPQADGQGEQAPPTTEGLKVVKAVTAATGVKNDRPWKRYAIAFSDDRVTSTFSKTLFERAQEAMTRGAVVTVTTKPGQKEGTLDLETLEILP